MKALNLLTKFLNANATSETTLIQKFAMELEKKKQTLFRKIIENTSTIKAKLETSKTKTTPSEAVNFQEVLMV